MHGLGEEARRVGVKPAGEFDQEVGAVDGDGDEHHFAAECLENGRVRVLIVGVRVLQLIDAILVVAQRLFQNERLSTLLLVFALSLLFLFGDVLERAPDRDRLGLHVRAQVDADEVLGAAVRVERIAAFVLLESF